MKNRKSNFVMKAGTAACALAMTLSYSTAFSAGQLSENSALKQVRSTVVTTTAPNTNQDQIPKQTAQRALLDPFQDLTLSMEKMSEEHSDAFPEINLKLSSLNAQERALFNPIWIMEERIKAKKKEIAELQQRIAVSMTAIWPAAQKLSNEQDQLIQAKGTDPKSRHFISMPDFINRFKVALNSKVNRCELRLDGNNLIVKTENQLVEVELDMDREVVVSLPFSGSSLHLHYEQFGDEYAQKRPSRSIDDLYKRNRNGSFIRLEYEHDFAGKYSSNRTDQIYRATFGGKDIRSKIPTWFGLSSSLPSLPDHVDPNVVSCGVFSF